MTHTYWKTDNVLWNTFEYKFNLYFIWKKVVHTINKFGLKIKKIVISLDFNLALKLKMKRNMIYTLVKLMSYIYYSNVKYN